MKDNSSLSDDQRSTGVPASRDRSSLIGPLIAHDRTALRYGFAIATVLIVCGLRLALAPTIGSQAPLLPFALAVLVASSVGGPGPGLLAAVLSPLVVTPLFTAWPSEALTIGWGGHVAFFLIISALITAVMDRLQRTAQAQAAALRELHKSQLQASRNEEQLRLIADALPVLISYVDAEQRYRFNNRCYREWFGVDLKEVIGRTAREVLGDAAYAAIQRHLEAALRGKHVRFEAELPYQTGVRYVQVDYVPDFGPDNVVRGIFALVEDIGERKRVEQALRDADRRKDEFLAMLAHELRNPLAPISNIAHILTNEKLDAATVRRSSEVLQRQASHLARLVDDLLDVARITHGSVELRKERIAIGDVLDMALETVTPLLAAKHQTATVASMTTLLFVRGDASRLSQVFGNILINASKFSPEGARIDIKIEHSNDDVSIRVRDYGVGIEASDLTKIFEIFAQADRSPDRGSGGLGVGLTVVKALIEMHGGQVDVRSDGKGKGSEFVVRLPRWIEEDRELPRRASRN